MKNNLFFFLLLGGIFFLVYALQTFVIQYFEKDLFLNIGEVNLFHFFLTIILFSVVYKVNQIKKIYTGYAFLIVSSLQMFCCVAFLFPLISSTKTNKEIDTLIFMSSYFVGLFLSVIRTSNLLK